jgi:hypothetical protein
MAAVPPTDEYNTSLEELFLFYFIFFSQLLIEKACVHCHSLITVTEKRRQLPTLSLSLCPVRRITESIAAVPATQSDRSSVAVSVTRVGATRQRYHDHSSLL